MAVVLAVLDGMGYFAASCAGIAAKRTRISCRYIPWAKTAHVRVEACDTCRIYNKAVDLTIDGHAVPVVDDIATIDLDIWAEEHGYDRLATSIVGT